MSAHATSVRLTISSGLGPVEVRAFVAALAVAIESMARDRGVLVAHRVVHGPLEAPSSIDLALEGPCARLSDLVGTHALLARSATRGKRDRKRWFAGVRIAATAAIAPLEIDPRDVVIDACRSSGAGGQHVQKTASAVRALHRPSGISIRVENERSQHQNRSVALARLAEVLAERARHAKASDAKHRRLACLRVERGLPVRTWRFDGIELVSEEQNDAK